MPGNNPAQRIVDLLEKVPRVGQQEPMVNGLKALFAYEPADAYRGHAKRLEQVLVQIDLAERGLVALQFPSSLFARQFTQARNAFTPSALNSNFSHVTGHVTTDVVLAFRWAAFALPDEGEQLKPESLDALITEVAALLDEPALQGLPQVLRDKLIEHLTAMLIALRGCPVTGSEPLQKAVKDLGLDLATNKDSFDTAIESADARSKPFLDRTKAFIRKAVEAASIAGKGAEGVEKVWKLASERGPQLIDWAKGIWNG
jgi:hypothetical protein